MCVPLMLLELQPLLAACTIQTRTRTKIQTRINQQGKNFQDNNRNKSTAPSGGFLTTSDKTKKKQKVKGRGLTKARLVQTKLSILA